MIYDITRELFSAEFYPGDPIPRKEFVMSFENEEPDVCQLTELVMGSHNGTHMDAPKHFCPNGKNIDQVELEKCMGPCVVVETSKHATKEELEELLKGEKCSRILLKGAEDVTAECAEYIVEKGIVCVGVESLSVGPFSAPAKVHRILLGAEVVILESLDLSKVPAGTYELIALPLKMSGLDGSPVRAVLRSE